MKKNIGITLLMLTLFIQAFAQDKHIYQFENGLTETRELVFADTLYPSYTIYSRMKFYKIPSVSIAVINQGKIEWAKTYGYADLNAHRPANKQTLYQVASISKSVNSFAIMRLVQNGQLSLTQDIRSYLKTWEFPDNDLSKGKTITLKNLLSHTAGLSVRGFVGYATTDEIPTINQILNGEKPANNQPVVPIFAPGTTYQYSGGGYAVLRKILNDNIHEEYDQLLKRLVLKPLHMASSNFSQPLQKKYKNFAIGYDKDEMPLKGNFYTYPEKTAGGLWSTATDIAQFIIAVQHSLKDDNGLLSRENCTQMLTPILNQYALGFGVDEKGGEKYFWHEGESFGYRSIYYGSFTTGKGVVILTNAYPENGRPFVYEVLNSIATTYNWKDFYNPVKKKLVSVPDSVLAQYTGEYFSENPAIKITVSQKGSELLLTARQPEKMYPIAQNIFFLKSSPNDDCTFSSSTGNGVMDVLEVKQNGKTIIKALKK